MNEKLAREIRTLVRQNRLVEEGKHTLKGAWRRVLARMSHRERGAFRRLMRKEPLKAAGYVLEKDTRNRSTAA